jgi:hypothetical protein
VSIAGRTPARIFARATPAVVAAVLSLILSGRVRRSLIGFSLRIHPRGIGSRGGGNGHERFGVKAGAFQRMNQGIQILAQRGFEICVPGSHHHLDLAGSLGDLQIDGRGLRL